MVADADEAGTRGTDKIVDALMPDCVSWLLYTSDAADERSSVDLGGRRSIKKKRKKRKKKIKKTLKSQTTTTIMERQMTTTSQKKKN